MLCNGLMLQTGNVRIFLAFFSLGVRIEVVLKPFQYTSPREVRVQELCTNYSKKEKQPLKFFFGELWELLATFLADQISIEFCVFQNPSWNFISKNVFKGHLFTFRYRKTSFRYMLRCKFCIHLLVFILHFLKKNHYHFTLMYANVFKFLNSTMRTLWNYLQILKILPVTHFRGVGGDIWTLKAL